MLELEGVGRMSRGGGLEDLSVSVGPGGAVAISGPTGAGKTALAELAAARALPDAGVVRILGRDVSRLRRSSLARLRRQVGFAPQELDLFDAETALANVALALEVCGASRRLARAAGLEALEIFGIGDAAEVPAGELSAGERRQVGLARAAAGAPRVLVADDPTAGLDPAAAADALAAVDELRAAGAAVAVLSSDPAAALAAREHGWDCYRLARGELRLQERPRRADTEPGGAEVVLFPAAVAPGGLE